MIRSINSLLLNGRCTYSGCINLTQKRTSFYNKYKHGPMRISNPSPDYIQWVKDFFGPEGIEWFKGEVIRIVKKGFRTNIPKPIDRRETTIFEHFDTDESVKRWKPVADSDSLNGFSVASMVRSPAGHALFKGVLDNRLPDDGLTEKSGFVGAIGPKKPRDHIFAVEECWDWSRYNCIEVRFRGDGRKYGFVVNTGTYEDDTRYYDAFYFPLHTKGGPYWQTRRIPFSKLVFNFKGFIQDEQGSFPHYSPKFVAFVLQDTYDGPFQLEIDYVGLRNEMFPFTEVCAYERYSFPHIKYRPLQVDCPAPE